jgi:signal transduction histidine kinase
MRELLGMIVGREFKVRFATNGREALDSFRACPPDLVLSDVMMPEMSGIELCRTLKGDESTRAVPIVLVTSKAEREMKIEGLELGADDYVSKPFHPRELMARVRSLVRVRKLQKELAIRNESLEQALMNLQQAEVQLVQSERLAAVGELAAGIAHEVNNPVNFALNAARAMEPTVKELGEATCGIAEFEWENLERLAGQIEAYRGGHRQEQVGELAGALKELAEIVTEGLTRTSSLVGDLRDFAVVSRSSERVAGVDVAKGIRSTIQLLKHSLADSNATLDFEFADNVPTVSADSGALNQVFLNLIKNAAEAMEDGGGAIHVSLSHEDDWVVVHVVDNGPGIPSDVVAQLFNPFFTTKDAGKGTGLGLSISRNIIDAHEGELTVESEPGAGARFTVRLPVAPASPSI